LEEEIESSTARKRLWLSDDDGSDDDSFNLPEEEEELPSGESSMNQLDTSEEKSLAKHDHSIIFSDDGDTSSSSSKPRVPKTSSSRMRFDPDSSNIDDF
jgi:hypothetical protein